LFFSALGAVDFPYNFHPVIPSDLLPKQSLLTDIIKLFALFVNPSEYEKNLGINGNKNDNPAKRHPNDDF